MVSRAAGFATCQHGNVSPILVDSQRVTQESQFLLFNGVANDVGRGTSASARARRFFGEIFSIAVALALFLPGGFPALFSLGVD